MRNIDALQSIVIVRCGNGYEATARFADPKHDFIVSHEYKGSVYSLINRMLYPPARRKYRRRNG